jgi:hypothetical protein
LLKCNDDTSKYLIETFEYKDNYQLIDCIEKFRHIYLKPKGGSRSKGIFFVERLDNNVYEVNYRKTNAEDIKLKADMNNLLDILEQEISNMEFVKSDYILQEAISLSRINNRNFEIRVVMQKNSKNIWIRTCMVARTAGENEKFINISTESDVKSSQIVTESFGENEREELRKASKAVTELLDSSNIQAGEIAIDFGIDENKKLYIIELNSKPDNLLAAIKAYKMRNLAVYRLLEYAKFLASK